MNDPNDKSLAPEYFDRVYNAADDPWNFASSQYEAANYAATVAALPDENYRSAFAWNTFMQNPEAQSAMLKAGFQYA